MQNHCIGPLLEYNQTSIFYIIIISPPSRLSIINYPCYNWIYIPWGNLQASFVIKILLLFLKQGNKIKVLKWTKKSKILSVISTLKATHIITERILNNAGGQSMIDAYRAKYCLGYINQGSLYAGIVGTEYHLHPNNEKGFKRLMLSHPFSFPLFGLRGRQNFCGAHNFRSNFVDIQKTIFNISTFFKHSVGFLLIYKHIFDHEKFG